MQATLYSENVRKESTSIIGTVSIFESKDVSSIEREVQDKTNNNNPQVFLTEKYTKVAEIPSEIVISTKVNYVETKPSQNLETKIASTILFDSPVEGILNKVMSSEAVKSSMNAAFQTIEDKPEGPISKFVKGGGKIPILLLTCNRPELLKQTFNSLLAVRGIEKENIIVIQDGSMREVAEIVRSQGLRLIQNTAGIHLRGANIDGAQRIAMHYRFALTSVFDVLPTAPAVIIIEDDLLFSPDFYEYFHTMAPLLEDDPSLFLISAWNDNGFKNKVMNPYTMHRTGFFPGLGWLLPKILYKNELERKWPSEHWDHWLRSSSINKGREIAFPQVLVTICSHYCH